MSAWNIFPPYVYKIRKLKKSSKVKKKKDWEYQKTVNFNVAECSQMVILK